MEIYSSNFQSLGDIGTGCTMKDFELKNNQIDYQEQEQNNEILRINKVNDNDTRYLNSRVLKLAKGSSTNDQLTFHHLKDERKLVQDASIHPCCYTGCLMAKFQSSLIYGTAFAVSSQFLLTAGHNLYDRRSKQFPKSIIFYPGLNGNQLEGIFGEVYHIPKNFLNTNCIDQSDANDYCIIKLTQPLKSYDLKLQLIVDNEAISQKDILYTYGYPQDKNLHQKQLIKMYGCSSKVKENGRNFITYMMATSAGQSGSAILIKEGSRYKIVGIHIAGSTNGNYAIKLNQQIITFVEQIRKNKQKDYNLPIKKQSYRNQNFKLDNLKSVKCQKNLNKNKQIFFKYFDKSQGRQLQYKIKSQIQEDKNDLPRQYYDFSYIIMKMLKFRGHRIQGVNLSQSNLRLQGLVYKRSQFLKIWKKRRIRFGAQKLQSFRQLYNFKQQYPSFVVKSSEILEIETSFDFLDIQQAHQDGTQKKLLIIKLICACRQVFFGIPISQFRNNKNWLHSFYSLMHSKNPVSEQIIHQVQLIQTEPES